MREIVRQCLGAVEFAGDGGQAREGKSTPAPPHMHAKRVRNASERPGIPCSAVLADLHLSPSPLTWRPCSRCEKGFKIEYAKSGRAGCKGCGQKIEQGGLRLGKMIPSPHFDGYVSCVCARARAKKCLFRCQDLGAEADSETAACCPQGVRRSACADLGVYWFGRFRCGYVPSIWVIACCELPACHCHPAAADTRARLRGLRDANVV